MNPLKKLASQTAIYGIPGIAGRFLNYLLTYLYTRVFTTGQFGVNAEFYAYSGFFLVLLSFGLETGFFRFQQDEGKRENVYSTALGFITLASALMLGLIYAFGQPLANALHYENHVEYIYWFAWILALDSVCALPFARLRAQNRALQFAFIKVAEIIVNIALNVFFLVLCRHAYEAQTGSWLAGCYNPEIGVGYVFIANLIASATKAVLLSPHLLPLKAGIDGALLRQLLRYSLPMVVIGFAGIINEMLDRMLLKYLLPGTMEENLAQLGIYSANYKLAVLMTLFIQAFRFAAEPFFFSQAKQQNAGKVYSDVLKYFTIFCVLVFLGVMVFIDWIQLFIGADFREGLKAVPVLLIANLFLGIYINLSIWYKLTDRTMMGAWVSLGGAAVTILLNVLLVPTYGYMASAWATLVCYAGMVAVSYALGQKYYPVAYEPGRLLAYIAGAVGLWWLFENITGGSGPEGRFAAAVLTLSVFTAAVYLAEIRPLRKKVKV